MALGKRDWATEVRAVTPRPLGRACVYKEEQAGRGWVPEEVSRVFALQRPCSQLTVLCRPLTLKSCIPPCNPYPGRAPCCDPRGHRGGNRSSRYQEARVLIGTDPHHAREHKAGIAVRPWTREMHSLTCLFSREVPPTAGWPGRAHRLCSGHTVARLFSTLNSCPSLNIFGFQFIFSFL